MACMHRTLDCILGAKLRHGAGGNMAPTDTALEAVEAGGATGWRQHPAGSRAHVVFDG